MSPSPHKEIDELRERVERVEAELEKHRAALLELRHLARMHRVAGEPASGEALDCLDEDD